MIFLEVAEHPDLPRPFGLITAEADSPLARCAGMSALVTVKHQRAVTHSQAYLGSAVVLLDLIGRLAGDGPLRRAVTEVPELLARQLAAAPEWSADALAKVGDGVPRAAIAFGSGPSWAAAQEAALLLKEVAAIQTEGVETREGATTAMYALDDAHLVLALAQQGDRLVEEAAAVCKSRGAGVITSPWVAGTDRRLGLVGHFLYPLALSIDLAVTQGLSPDHPPWYAAYVATARRTPLSEEST